MGTPQFAVTSLKAITASRHEVVTVVTVPDKPVGRGLKVRPSPVKEEALRHGVPIVQPENLGDPAFAEQLRALNADVFVVVAFKILPPEVFEIPAKKTVNLHASLLPKYRGAAPINWAIMNGDSKTGVSTIFIERSVDTGDLIMQRETEIKGGETAGELHDRLAALGADLLVETLDRIDQGRAIPSRQTGDATKAPKISRELCRVDWKQSSASVRNLIHGLSPSPGAYSTLNGKLVKFFRARLVDRVDLTLTPGQILEEYLGERQLCIATDSGAVRIDELQPEGKRRMTAGEFLLGWQTRPGDRFGRD